jgi:hypothetical protein
MDTVSSKKPHLYTFRKLFKNADEINLAYKSVPNSMSQFKRELKVEKKFRWFYSYLTYSEECQKLASGNYKPFEMYLSDIEKEARKAKNSDSLAQILQMDSAAADNFKKSIDKKFEQWLDSNLSQEVILQIEKDMKKCNINSITIKDLNSKRDSIYAIADSVGMKKGFSDFYKALNKIFKTNEFDKIINSGETGMQNLEDEIGYVIALSGYNYKLKMPGLLMDTNAETVKGNQLDWEFVPFEAYFVGNKQFAESRIVNVWAFAVSGVLLIIVVLILFIPAFRRKRQLN